MNAENHPKAQVLRIANSSFRLDWIMIVVGVIVFCALAIVLAMNSGLFRNGNPGGYRPMADAMVLSGYIEEIPFAPKGETVSKVDVGKVGLPLSVPLTRLSDNGYSVFAITLADGRRLLIVDSGADERPSLVVEEDSVLVVP